MATLEDYRNPAFVKFCESALEGFMNETSGVKNVLLATTDGFQVTSRSSGAADKHSADNLAAVGSSLFALGASLAGEFELGESRSITIDSDKGKVYIRAIDGGKDKSLILLLEAGQQAMLAHILHGSRKLAESISKRLSLIG
ncbi:roadblock/LC7 domain-containing protein [Suttonella ornithocola]|uniref:Roadblock/LC7 domain n=1 Tax=Suttonella ornithocola TaxID=279832 RepID=A0A380MVX0_9GAMM|nr:roadblock/LC7 domain-containing protein [Suttonella ornithocola]SUO95547.1 Roadblock/LC7 domain [Suttonella ornithocola]